jgi:lysine decarboxylase
MPGHKRNPAFLPPDLPFWDMTEIPGMDNLHAPCGIINKLQERIAEIYGADESFLLVNGSSSGIIAAVNAACAENETVHIARNTHKSIFNALVLSGASPKYIQPKYFPDGLAGGLLPWDFFGAKVAVITSPTYEGFLPDVKSISEQVHKRGGILIVDEAHGAHFPFHKEFPSNALANGADIVINSLHKTLPAISQTAVLHVKGAGANRERLKFFLQAMQTTSPSYILMGLVSFFLEQHLDGLFDIYVNNLIDLRIHLTEENAAVRLSGIERAGEYGVKEIDISKLLFNLYGEIDETAFTRDYKLQMEMFNLRHMLAMTSVADTATGFDRLGHAIRDLNRKLVCREEDFAPVKPPPLPEMVVVPREALGRETETIPRAEAPGRIAAKVYAPYPPGVPVLVPGERITEEILEYIYESDLHVLM